MAHPNEIIKKQAPNRIVLVDEAQTFAGKFYAYTPVILASGTTSFNVEIESDGGVKQYDGTKEDFIETAAETAISMPAAVGVTVFGQFSKFTGVADCSVILYLDEQDR